MTAPPKIFNNFIGIFSGHALAFTKAKSGAKVQKNPNYASFEHKYLNLFA